MKADIAQRGTPRILPIARALPLLGATFVISVAYVDPGNYATNIQAGSQFGYQLLWVVATASVVGMLVQYLSAKLGIVTGRSLPQLCRERYAGWRVVALWFQAELVCVFTDIAEFTGTAIALNLLFRMPLLVGGIVAAVVSTVLLLLGPERHHRFTWVMCAMLAVVLVCFLYEALGTGMSTSAAAAGLLPRPGGSSYLLLAAGIVGATVMPHVVYLHSATAPGSLVTTRGQRETGWTRPVWRTRLLLRAQRRYVVIALGIAGIVNMLMLMVAASVLGPRYGQAATIPQAGAALHRVVGQAAAVIFGISLLASGIASSCVGTYSGQIAMQGFLQRSIPLIVRRAATVVPALLVLASGAEPTTVLVISQVVLSFGLPFVLVPMVVLTGDKRLMGPHTNSWVTRGVAIVVVAAIILLNGLLLVTT